MATIEKANTIQGLSDKLASKLTWPKDKPRIFQLVGTGELDTFNHNVEAGIQGLEIKRGGAYPAQTTIYDKYEQGANKVKVIYNITGRITKQNEKGETYTIDQTESLVFDKNGQCIVQPGNKDLLARVLLSDNNGTNTDRRTTDSSGGNIQVLWEEVRDHTIEAQEKRRLGELEDIARSAIKSMRVEPYWLQV